MGDTAAGTRDPRHLQLGRRRVEDLPVEVTPRRTARERRQARLAAAVLLLGGAAWWAAPQDASGVATATLTLDSGSGSLFAAAGPLGPGTPRQACVQVAVTGAGAGDEVTVAAENVSGSLAGHLLLTVELGTGGGHGDCTGFTGAQVYSGTLAGLAAASTADGVPTGWSPGSGAAQQTFRLTVRAEDVTGVAGTTAQGQFAWRLVPAVQPPSTTPTATGPSTTAPSATTTSATTTSPTRTSATTTSATTTSPTRTSPTTSPTKTSTTGPTGTATSTTPATTSTTGAPTTTAAPSATAGPGVPPAAGPAGPGPDDTAGPTATGPETTAGPARPTSSPPAGAAPPTSTGPGPGPGDPDVRLDAHRSVRATVTAAIGGAVRRATTRLLGPLLGTETAEKVGVTLTGVITNPQYPMLGVVAMFLFLLVQDRLDNRDPKLAAASLSRRDQELIFRDIFDPGGPGTAAAAS